MIARSSPIVQQESRTVIAVHRDIDVSVVVQVSGSRAPGGIPAFEGPGNLLEPPSAIPEQQQRLAVTLKSIREFDVIHHVPLRDE